MNKIKLLSAAALITCSVAGSSAFAMASSNVAPTPTSISFKYKNAAKPVYVFLGKGLQYLTDQTDYLKQTTTNTRLKFDFKKWSEEHHDDHNLTVCPWGTEIGNAGVVKAKCAYASITMNQANTCTYDDTGKSLTCSTSPQPPNPQPPTPQPPTKPSYKFYYEDSDNNTDIDATKFKLEYLQNGYSVWITISNNTHQHPTTSATETITVPEKLTSLDSHTTCSLKTEAEQTQVQLSAKSVNAIKYTCNGAPEKKTQLKFTQLKNSPNSLLDVQLSGYDTAAHLCPSVFTKKDRISAIHAPCPNEQTSPYSSYNGSCCYSFPQGIQPNIKAENSYVLTGTISNQSDSQTYEIVNSKPMTAENPA